MFVCSFAKVHRSMKSKSNVENAPEMIRESLPVNEKMNGYKIAIHEDRLCLVSCTALKAEIQELVKKGDLDTDLVFVSKFFHGDYARLEENLRKVLSRMPTHSRERSVLVYGDLCLGPNDEMKKLAEEYGIAKVEAATCIDCLFGGKGKSSGVDPSHRLLLLDPGMIDFYSYLKVKARQDGIDEDRFRQFFDGLNGIILLDTLGEAEKNLEEIDKLGLGLPVLETKRIELQNLRLVILEAKKRRPGRAHRNVDKL